MKRFLKGFLKTILWLIATLALCISLFLGARYMETDKSDKYDIAILQIEKEIDELEKKNEELEKEIEDLQYSIENHIHTQYLLKTFYQGKGNDFQFKYDTVRIKQNPKYFGKGA